MQNIARRFCILEFPIRRSNNRDIVGMLHPLLDVMADTVGRLAFPTTLDAISDTNDVEDKACPLFTP